MRLFRCPRLAAKLGLGRRGPNEFGSNGGNSGRGGCGGSNVKENYKNGKSWEREVKKGLEKDNHTDISEQVTVKTKSGTNVKPDFLSRDQNGNVKVTEAKGSQDAPLTPNQTKGFPEIEQSSGTVVGAGKPGFPGGTTIPPTPVDIARKP